MDSATEPLLKDTLSSSTNRKTRASSAGTSGNKLLVVSPSKRLSKQALAAEETHYTVIGASGFIGQHLCVYLSSLPQAHVHIVARRTSDLGSLLGSLRGRYTRHDGELDDWESLAEAMGPGYAVFHLAAMISYSPKDFKQMQRINVEGTANVLRACAAKKVARLVYMSSIVTVGMNVRPTDPLLNEQSPYPKALSDLKLGYFITKCDAEALVLKAAKEGTVNAVVLCPANVYGAGDAAKATRSVQVKVARGGFPFYTQGGINAVHVQDVVECCVLALSKGKIGERYIIAGENMTVKKLLNMYAQEAAAKPPYITLPSWLLVMMSYLGFAPVEKTKAAQMFGYYDGSKAQKELGYTPRSAESAVRDSVRYMLDHGMLDETKPGMHPGSYIRLVAVLVVLAVMVVLIKLLAVN